MRRKAVGIHVFAGGFTLGVKEHFDVTHQLEVHGFGLETARAVAGVEPINSPPEEWPDIEAEFAFGNPRCTGFSTITCGYDDDTHGPWAKQTCDIHQFCEYVAGRYDIAIWESVQQAYTVGKPLLDHLRDNIFAPKHYRVAHVFVNAATFGNAQHRKRYFFVAYRDDRKFNISPPEIGHWYPVMYDAIWDLRNRATHEMESPDSYDFDAYARLNRDEKHCVPHLPNGWSLNALAQYSSEILPERYGNTWLTRTSNMPFSLHCISRTNWMRPSPTLHSSASRFIHPLHDRPLTIGELATIMGWPDVPRGEKPIAQLAKGVVPSVGAWLAKQAEYYLDGAWGEEDYESRYDPRTGEWVGRGVGPDEEKVFDMTQLVSPHFDIERYPRECIEQVRNSRFNVARSIASAPRHRREY